MKTIRGRLLCLTAPLLLAAAALAQEPEGEPFPPPEPDEPAPPGFPAFAGPPGPPPGPEGPVDIWMDRVERRNPEEYRRLHQLRHQNPEGFRKELDHRLRRERSEAIMAAHPRLRTFLESLPEPERLEVLQALARALGPPRHAPAGPETQSWRDDIRRLAREYRTTGDPGRRDELQSELRAKLGGMFDAREQERTRHLERIQSEAARLQQALESRRLRREEIIERRLRELTDDETTEW